MKRSLRTVLASSIAFGAALAGLLAGGCRAEAPSATAVAAFQSYAGAVEARLVEQHRTVNTFLVLPARASQGEQRLRRRELILENLAPDGRTDLPGAMLHRWRGTAFVPGAKAADFERLMKDFTAYPKRFSPQVLRAGLLSSQDGRPNDRFQATMRVRQKHGITVVMDTDYDIAYGRLDAGHGYSISRSTRIAEIESAGTGAERALSPSEGKGILWRLNTYWSYEERDGGLYMQVESISLTRSIPVGLGWLVRPFVESVPRESLEFTLQSVCKALRK